MAEDSPFTVDAEWLEQRLGQPGLTIVDASWYLPAQKRDARKEYDAAHIPGAVFLDHDAISDRNSSLPHTLAAPRDFAQYVGSMGISADDTIVVYDGPGFFSAPRAWWMFRVMGVFQTYILDGGSDHWKAGGRPVTAEPTRTAPGSFMPISMPIEWHPWPTCVVWCRAEKARSLMPVRPAASPALNRSRAPACATATCPAPTTCLTIACRRTVCCCPTRLREIVEDAGIDLTKPVVTSCGSGITAAVITLALETLGHTDNRLYDGSWTEWGGLADTPVVTGKER